MGQHLNDELISLMGRGITYLPQDDLGRTCLDDSLLISLIDCDISPESLFDTLRWTILKRLTHASSQCLWISRELHVQVNGPIAESMTGLARSVRSENSNQSFRTVVFGERCEAKNIAQKIALIARKLLTSANDVECEYRNIDGVLCTNRIVESRQMNADIDARRGLTRSHHMSLASQADRDLTLKIRSPGLLDTFYFEEESASDNRSLEDNAVEIEVKAVGLNFKDVLITLGQVPEASFGLECSGRVSSVGSNVKHVEVGDKVFCCASDVFKTRVKVNANMVHRVPDTLTYYEAAAIPIVFSTAFYALHDVAHLKQGETVLIQSAAGGVGQAAVQIAQHIGAEIFVTVGSDTKKALMMDRYGMQEDHIFYSRNGTFGSGIRRKTLDGVDVILNSLSGELLQESWTCIAPFGRFIEIGKKDILGDSRLSMVPFSKNVTFSSVDLGFIAAKAPDLLAHVLRKIGSMLWQEPAKITPGYPVHILEPSEIEKAFRFLQSGKNTGKTVINMESNEEVQVGFSFNRPWRFH